MLVNVLITVGLVVALLGLYELGQRIGGSK